MKVIKNCRLVSALTEGFSEEYGDVYVEDGRIRAVVPAGSEGIKTDADEVIDAEGKTLIPGLFEMHAHLYGFIFNPYELQCMTA